MVRCAEALHNSAAALGSGPGASKDDSLRVRTVRDSEQVVTGERTKAEHTIAVPFLTCVGAKRRSASVDRPVAAAAAGSSYSAGVGLLGIPVGVGSEGDVSCM